MGSETKPAEATPPPPSRQLPCLEPLGLACPLGRGPESKYEYVARRIKTYCDAFAPSMELASVGKNDDS